MIYSSRFASIVITSFLFVVIPVSITGIADAAVAQDAKKFTLKELPAAVRTAFEKSYPKAVIKGVDKEIKDGKTYYEVESMDGTQKRDLLYTSDGTLYEIEEAITAAALPESVKAALTKTHASGKITDAEKITQGATVTFEVVVQTGETKEEILLDASGKILKTEKLGKEKPEDDKD